MRITVVEASCSACEHMWGKHRVELWEVEEVLLGVHDVVRVGSGRYAYVGRTLGGRLLRVIFEVEAQRADATARVITAIPLRR